MDLFSNRIRRVVENLMGNESLADGLETSAASALLDWGIELARDIVASTGDMDDETAETAMYPRLKATRKLMRFTGKWVSGQTQLGDDDRLYYWNKIVENAQILYGEHFSPPETEKMQRLSGSLTPTELINLLRGMFDSEFGGNKKNDKK